ncbi:MAG TPA: phage holin family protein [Myxococcales bacterium]|nr:phage holin family protein [Myxococcales bacterium]
MAILQALISYLGKSAGKALNAIFGWAVLALFGQTSPKEQTLLSAVVAAAAAWPILLMGVIVPKVALFVVSFVPLAKSVPNAWLRLIWLALALVVPVVVGTVVAKRGAQDRMAEPRWKKFLRGFPITLALACAFLLMLVVAPILRIVTVLRRREVVRIPAVMDKGVTGEAMAALADELERNQIDLQRATAPWHQTAPAKILLKIGGAPFKAMASKHVEYRRNGELEVTVLPNETILRGKPALVAQARALCAEVYGPRPVVQSFAAEARELEMHAKRLWRIYLEQPRAHRRSAVLEGRLSELSAELSRRTLPWDEWQIVYRLLLQVDRALHGDEPLLRHAQKEEYMADERVALPGPRNMEKLPARIPADRALPVSVEGMTNRELVGHVVESATMLAKKEIELAKAELKADLKKEVAMAKGLGVAGLCALWTVSMMLVAGAMALGTVLPEWAAALIVAAGVLAVGSIAGLVGWGKRVKEPLEATRRSLKEDALWAKERLA